MVAHIAHLAFGKIYHGLITKADTIHKLHASQILRITYVREATTKEVRLVTKCLTVHLIPLRLLQGQ